MPIAYKSKIADDSVRLIVFMAGGRAYVGISQNFRSYQTHA